MAIKWYTRENNLDKILLKLFPDFTCHYLITDSSKLVFPFLAYWPSELSHEATRNLYFPWPLTTFRYRIKQTLLKPSANGRNIVGCYMLRRLHTLVCVVESCCAKFETGQTFSYVQTNATAPNNAGFAQGLRA